MNIRRVVPNITTSLVDESLTFYTELFGFKVVMDMDWIVTLASPDNPVIQISLIRSDQPTLAPVTMTLSIEVGDIDGVHAKAVKLGQPIVYPLTNESWGVRRFHVKDPNGVVINVLSHIREK